MAQRKTLKRLPWDAPTWERLPWDTSKGYDMFTLYYLPQRPPRSVNEAYRLYKRIKDTTREAPTNWRRWSGGTWRDGSRRHYIRINEDGTEEVLPVPTWRERGDALDSDIARKNTEKIELEALQVMEEMRRETRAAYHKLAQSLRAYKPKGEGIGELSVALMRINKELRELYGLDVEEELEDVEDLAPAGAQVTDLDRVNEIASILARAVERKRGGGGG